MGPRCIDIYSTVRVTGMVNFSDFSAMQSISKLPHLRSMRVILFNIIFFNNTDHDYIACIKLPGGKYTFTLIMRI